LKICIASGKGGTGKTTVATNLARIAPLQVTYVDCDVEEPNGHIFLAPDIRERIAVTVPSPEVDDRLCDFCGKCGEVCRFNAIAVLPSRVMVFSELCHGCGGCSIACPTGAIHEEQREIGVVALGRSGSVEFIAGTLNVGEAMAPPLIRAVKKMIPEDGMTIIDASPGTSCSVITAVQDCDYCLLVTEPTPFGLNDLKLAVEMVRKISIPFGVVINRYGIGNGDMEEYCLSEGIRVLSRIPDDRRAAETYSRGDMMVDVLPHMRGKIIDLMQEIIGEHRANKLQPEIEGFRNGDEQRRRSLLE
jgi:MinD superfamily P-loop ATPase